MTEPITGDLVAVTVALVWGIIIAVLVYLEITSPPQDKGKE